MKGVKLFNEDDFLTLSPEEQIEWVESYTEKVLKRLPTLKKNLTTYEDKSNELYNLSEGEIRLLSKTHIADIKTGRATGTSLLRYARQLGRYGSQGIDVLSWENASARFNNFLDVARKNASSEDELQYIDELAGKLDKEDIINFTKSKSFFEYADLNSESAYEFKNSYGISVATMRLEVFVEQNHLGVTDRIFYEDETRVKLGRPKRRKR